MVDVIVAAMNQLDVPTVVLFIFTLVGLRAAEQAQRRDDFDWGDAFRNDVGRVSFSSLAVLVALGVSTWLIIYCFMNGMRNSFSADDLVKVLDALYIYFATFIAIWALGPRFAERMGDAVLAKWSGTTRATVTTPDGTVATASSTPAGTPVIPQPQPLR